jgi:transposase-like protein
MPGDSLSTPVTILQLNYYETCCRVVRIFPNAQACLRLVTALAVEQSEEWVTGRRYLDMRELVEHRCEERGAQEVAVMER